MTVLAMNAAEQHARAAASDRVVPLRRVVLPGTLLAMGAALLVGVILRLPEGVAAHALAGIAAATITGVLGAGLKARAVAKPAQDPQAGTALQAAILGDFVLQLFVVGGGTLALFVADTKFESIAGFGLGFAAIALAHQAGSSLVLAKALRRRAAAAVRTAPSAPTHAPSTHDARIREVEKPQ
ncbi:MAG: hypothetical protein IT457_22790 [Planctomycetes bacterium]|nr:hypothetical protein [Planctomycetota bacterium]